MINVYGAATHHLNVRGQQRGITQEMINILVTYGSTHRHAGADITCFDKGSWKSVTKECPCSRQMLERLRKCYLVEIDGHPITVGHRCKRFKRDAH
mgnify:CR=1 FL=1|jgi:hypothetical protein